MEERTKTPTLMYGPTRAVPVALFLYACAAFSFVFCALYPTEPNRTFFSRCEYYECTRQPTYGMDGERAKFCSSHKEEGMIDVKNCRCKHQGCTRQPNYGHEGSRAKFCSSHKLDKMVNVVSRRCEFPGCKRQVIFSSCVGRYDTLCVPVFIYFMQYVSLLCAPFQIIKSTTRFSFLS